MRILGIESSCDETSAAVVRDGRIIESLIIASQTEIHAKYHGVVPEVASRAHVEQILPVVQAALNEAEAKAYRSETCRDEPATTDRGSHRDIAGQESAANSEMFRTVTDSHKIDGVAVTNRPGLSGSLAVGLSFAKSYAWARDLPFIAVDHMHAHAYAAFLATDQPFDYPYLVLLVSGGHTMIAVSRGPDQLDVLGTTVDDACGEAYDKVSAFIGTGYPGGPIIDRLAAAGDPKACSFPQPRLNHANERYDLSYSGLKTAVVHQLDRFWNPAYPRTKENLAAAFQHAAVEMLITRVKNAIHDTGIRKVVAGGGVASNSELRRRLTELERDGVEVILPPPNLCVDNGAMVAGLGYQLLQRGDRSEWNVGVNARVSAFRRRPGMA